MKMTLRSLGLIGLLGGLGGAINITVAEQSLCGTIWGSLVGFGVWRAQ